MSFWKKLFASSTSRILEAARKGDLGKAKSLLKGNPNLVLCKDDYGLTPLHLAARDGHKDVAELLLTNKAEVNAKDNHARTPLYLAVDNGKDVGKV